MMSADRNQTLNHGFAMAAIAVLALGAVTLAQSGQDEKLSKIRIENFGRVNENFYRGAQPKPQDYPDLAVLGIKTVIDLERSGEADEQRLVEAAGMKFYRIGMGTSSRPPRDKVDLFLKLVSDPTNHPVFVHCHGGRHRTGLVTAVYRIERDGWEADRAYQEMKEFEFKKGFGHTALKHYVYEFYAEFIARKNAAQPTKGNAASK